MMKRFFIALLLLSIGMNIFFLLRSSRSTIPPSSSVDASFPFLSKRIFMEDQNDILINFIALRTKLQDFSKKTSERHGVYFEYLPSGVSIGINEKEPFILASLLKLPIAMGLRKEYENGTLLPTQKTTIKDEHVNAEYGTLWKKGAGTELTLQELERFMLIESDNTASNTLFELLPPTALDDVFDSLDIPKSVIGDFPVVTAKNYSSILRSLYLSSMLEKKDSNEILTILTETPFSDKLDAGVPEGIPVAHKIGVYISNDFKKRMYTDCGIIYPVKRPYILCVMTESDEERAKDIISTVSRIVYDYVTTTNGMTK